MWQRSEAGPWLRIRLVEASVVVGSAPGTVWRKQPVEPCVVGAVPVVPAVRSLAALVLFVGQSTVVVPVVLELGPLAPEVAPALAKLGLAAEPVAPLA